MHQPTFCHLPVRPLPVISGIVPLGQGHLSGRRLQCRDTSYRAARTTLSVRSAAQNDKTLTAFAVGAPGKTPAYSKKGISAPSISRQSFHLYMYEMFQFSNATRVPVHPFECLPVLQTKVMRSWNAPRCGTSLSPGVFLLSLSFSKALGAFCACSCRLVSWDFLVTTSRACRPSPWVINNNLGGGFGEQQILPQCLVVNGTVTLYCIPLALCSCTHATLLTPVHALQCLMGTEWRSPP